MIPKSNIIVDQRRNVGVVVVRFQVPNLTKAQRALLDYVADANDLVVILLGVSPVIDIDNPLSYVLRLQMLQEEKLPYPYITHPVMDISSNTEWCKNLDALLETLFPKIENNITLYGGRNSFIDKVYHDFNRRQHRTEYFNYTDLVISATQERDKIVGNIPINDPVFRAGIIYAVGNYVHTK